MAVIFDNSGVSTFQNTTASGVAFTWFNGTTANGAYVIVAIYNEGTANGFTGLGTTTAAVTFGGVAMTSLGFVYANNAVANGFIWVFGLAGVTGGVGNVAATTVSVTLTEATKNIQGYASSHSFRNVGAVGALQTAFGSAGTATKAVTSAAGNLVWGAVEGAQSTALSAFSLTTRQQISGSFPNFISGDSPGAASVTVSATTNFVWAVAGLNLIPLVPALERGRVPILRSSLY